MDKLFNIYDIVGDSLDTNVTFSNAITSSETAVVRANEASVSASASATSANSSNDSKVYIEDTLLPDINYKYGTIVRVNSTFTEAEDSVKELSTRVGSYVSQTAINLNAINNLCDTLDTLIVRTGLPGSVVEFSTSCGNPYLKVPRGDIGATGAMPTYSFTYDEVDGFLYVELIGAIESTDDTHPDTNINGVEI